MEDWEGVEFRVSATGAARPRSTTARVFTRETFTSAQAPTSETGCTCIPYNIERYSEPAIRQVENGIYKITTTAQNE